jgi:outer membrane protein assembly factor BamB
MRYAAFVVVALTCLASTRVLRGDWPQFRGPNSSGVAGGAPPPIEFGPGKNERWRIPLASGHSSPIVVGSSIFLTTFDKKERKLEVVCIARADGKIRWRRTVPAGDIEKGHPSFNPASSTPTCDGERVVAYFGSFGLICFDLEGEKLWDVKLPLTKTYCGNATSPVIVGDRVILYRGSYIDHFLLAVDKRTGKELWKKPQSERFTTDMACTGTPVVAGDRLILHSARGVQAFEISSGKRLWRAKCSTTATSTPVLSGDEVLIATWNQTGEPALVPEYPPFKELLEKNDKDGDKVISRGEFPRLMIFHRSEGTDAPQNGAPLRFGSVDKDKNGSLDADEWTELQTKSVKRRAKYIPHGILAIKIDSKGNLGPGQVRCLERKGVPEVPSPICHDGRVYFVKNGGILTCLDVKTGKRVYQMRTRGRGTHYASPIIADGKLFTTAGDGKISVLSLGPKPEILATNVLGERTYATPAIVDGTIYVRTHETLFAFALKK